MPDLLYIEGMDAKTERAARSRVNTQFQKSIPTYTNGLPLGQIDDILTANGFDAMQPAIYCGRDGMAHEQVGTKTWIALSWHKMEGTHGRYEIVVYVS
jgi:hypothetical protein